ncbi:methylated-DNA--[protein]-cysteine S-methyltransferase [Plantactinospora sp. KBS50]|uniref:methylated-DNA--[protein]-cysteine S-methyltransferase n=1 Tax=Plantactinospora sp. KBS50 TaxID=2024580 RepID=UPI000BAB1CF1|nr:methylated-DNA--[protein]-cysteine S-methyltransferase [Plantactinospora sp. KBS50]ASW53283.1 cysteine methyltransferase [Plantactinospora sp. KBS50]
MTILYTRLDTALGSVLITAEPGPGARHGVILTSVSLPEQRTGATVQPDWRHDDTRLTPIVDQLTDYLAGRRTAFELDMAATGTVTQTRVWQAVDAIPYGTTTTYGAITATAGLAPAAVRAVGRAIGSNPLLIVRPCHRVISAAGALTGYAAGLDRKRQLLILEGALPPHLI